MKPRLFSLGILPFLVPCAFCKSISSCPPGQILYETKDSNHVCCVPIVAPNFCGQHFRVQRCMEDGEPDTCIKCADGLVKFSNTTSGPEEDRCFRPVGCTEEAIPSSSKIGQCECNQSRCYYGDPVACTYFHFKCKENTYHKNGACVRCPRGTHRPGIGCGPCQRMSSLTSSVNTVSVPNPNSPKYVPTDVPIKSSMPALTNTEKGFVPEVDEAVDSRLLSAFPSWAIILIVLVALILIVLVILGIVWLVRKGKHKGLVRVPSNSSTPSDSTDSGSVRRPPLPPSYSESQINQTNQTHGSHDQLGQINQTNPTHGSHDQPGQINQNTGHYSGGTPERCNNQTAKPFQNSRYDTPSEHPVNGASQSFEPAQPLSTSFDLPPTGFSSGSSGPQDRVSTSGGAPDQTYLKVAAGGRESIEEQQRVLLKQPSGVVPVGDDDDDDGPLLRSAPSLDPDSIQQDNH